MLGLFAIYKLIISYASYSQLGQLQSLSRQIPIAYGVDDLKRVKKIKNILFSSYLITIFITISVVALLLQFDFILQGFFNKWNLIIILIIILVSQATTFLRSYIKAEGKFYILADFEIIVQIVRPIVGIVLIISFGLNGAIFNILILSCVTLFYYSSKLKDISLKFDFNLFETIKLVKPGFLLFINKIAGSLFWNIDIMIIGLLMTKSDIGYYSISLGLFISLGVFSRAIGMHMRRKILMKSELNMPIQKKYGFIISNNSLYLLYITMIFGSFSLIYISMIDTILTEYQPAKILIVILSFGYTIFVSKSWFSNYMDASNQLVKRLMIVLLGLVINAVLDYALISNGYGLMGVAFACVLGFITIAYLISFISLAQIKNNRWAALFYLIRHFTVTVILSLIIFYFSVNNLLNGFSFGLNNVYSLYVYTFLNTFIEISIFCIACIFLYPIIFKEDKIINKLYFYLNPLFSSYKNK